MSSVLGSYKLISFDKVADDRGALCSIEAGKSIPFEIKRVYYLFDVDINTPRGFHAHKQLSQVILCVSGSCKLLLDNGLKRESVILDEPNHGMLVEGLVWREMHNFSDDCVLVVLASEHYDEADYIRDYAEFEAMVNK